MNLSKSKYKLVEPYGGHAWCPSCNDFTESDVLVPDDANFPHFVICWNCHDVRQAGVGSLRDAELRNEAVQRYGETPVSEQPTSETDAYISKEEADYRNEIYRQIIRYVDERIRKSRYENGV
jgi:hypothetical protein